MEAVEERPALAAESASPAVPILELNFPVPSDSGHGLPVEALDRVWAAIAAQESPPIDKTRCSNRFNGSVTRT